MDTAVTNQPDQVLQWRNISTSVGNQLARVLQWGIMGAPTGPVATEGNMGARISNQRDFAYLSPFTVSAHW